MHRGCQWLGAVRAAQFRDALRCALQRRVLEAALRVRARVRARACSRVRVSSDLGGAAGALISEGHRAAGGGRQVAGLWAHRLIRTVALQHAWCPPISTGVAASFAVVLRLCFLSARGSRCVCVPGQLCARRDRMDRV